MKIMSSHVAVIGTARAMTHLWVASVETALLHTNTALNTLYTLHSLYRVTNLIVLSSGDPISILLSHVYAPAQLCQ